MKKINNIYFFSTSNGEITGGVDMRANQIVDEYKKQKNNKIHNINIINKKKLLKINNSIVIFIKHCFLANIKYVKELKKNNNKVICDVLDWIDQKKLNDELYDAPDLTKWLHLIDGFIVMNEYQKNKYEKKYNKLCYIVKHHWDPRLKNINIKNNTLDKLNLLYLGYIGHKKKNCLYLDNLKEENLIKHCNDFKIYEKEKLYNYYNCHYSIRKPDSWEYMNKPSIKLYTAAALNCNIIISDDLGAMEMLDKNYPYLIKRNNINYENVKKMIEYVNKTYKTKIWYQGLDMLKIIKEKTSIENIVKNYYIPFFDKAVNHFENS
jgi:hypothetical protein